MITCSRAPRRRRDPDLFYSLLAEVTLFLHLAFIGFVAGTVMKLAISFIMGYYFVINAFHL